VKSVSQAKTTLDVEEPLLSGDEYIVRPEDMALDLDATARSAAAGRVFWDGDTLVHLGSRRINCGSFLSHLTDEKKESFKHHTLMFVDSQRFSLSVVLHLIASFCTASIDNPFHAVDTTWVSAAIENSSFRTRTFQARIFFDYWKDRYPKAATDDALNLLAKVSRSPVTSNNVESDDPEKSWLTPEEFDDVLNSVWDNYELNGATQPALIRLLSLQYARRPSQLRGLKFLDLRSGDSKVIKGVTENEIHFPSVKEQGVEIEFRGGKFEPHPIADHLWNMLLIQKAEVKAAFEKVLGMKLTNEMTDQLPIFTTMTRIKKSSKAIRLILKSDPLEMLHDELFHLRVERVGKVISLVNNSPIISVTHWHTQLPVSPISQRTGQPLVLNAIRLRHSKARQLARMGVPKPVLSYWLGHNDDSAIDSYYSDPAEEARKLDEKMAPGLAPIALAFHGRLIASDAEATYPNDPLKSLEFAHNGLLKNVGKCGFYTLCGTSSIPLPCYRCRSFEPLVDAPHEEVLEILLFRQAQENDVVKLGSQRNALIPIDLSNDIRAVERCIELCKIKREQK
jgi:integrase